MANTNVTIKAAKVSTLTDVERATGGFTHKFNILYSDVNTGTGSADTVTMTLGTTPAPWIVTAACANVTTAFAGTTAFTIQIGTTTTTNAFVTAQSVLSAGLIQPANGISSVATPASATSTTAINLVALFTNATGGSPSALTAGALDVYLAMTDPAKFG